MTRVLVIWAAGFLAALLEAGLHLASVPGALAGTTPDLGLRADDNMDASEPSQEKCAVVFRPIFTKSKEIERFRDSMKRGAVLARAAFEGDPA